MSFIVFLFELIAWLACGATYASIGGSYARAVDSRVRDDSKHGLGVLSFLLVASVWPVTLTLWLLTCVLTRTYRPSPFSRHHEDARLAAAAAPIKTARDWEARAAYWYAEGQRAELEDDQALKWTVAENLAFLLDTQPPGAETPQEKAKRIDEMTFLNERTTTKQIAKTRARHARVGKSSPAARKFSKTPVSMSSPEIARKVKNLGIVTSQLAQTDHWVGLCNVCLRYCERNQLLMEGVCNECAADQGIQ